MGQERKRFINFFNYIYKFFYIIKLKFIVSFRTVMAATSWGFVQWLHIEIIKLKINMNINLNTNIISQREH